MVITSAVKQKNNPEMIRIYINDVYAFSMPAEEYYRMNLYERTELSQEDINFINDEINAKLAKQVSIRMLALKKMK